MSSHLHSADGHSLNSPTVSSTSRIVLSKDHYFLIKNSVIYICLIYGDVKKTVSITIHIAMRKTEYTLHDLEAYRTTFSYDTTKQLFNVVSYMRDFFTMQR